MNALDNSYALLIGVGGEGMEFTVDDATAIKNVLTDKEIAGYPPDNVILLTNERANKTEILNAFDELSKKVNKDSKVLLYYSGHGLKVNGQETYCLELHGAVPGKRKGKLIQGKIIKEKLNALVAERLIFFFDCCHAQGLTKGGGLLSTGVKMDAQQLAAEGEHVNLDNPEGLVQDIDDEEGLAIISSCKDHEKSIRWDNEKLSLFTTCLLEVLSGDHVDEIDDPYVRIMDVIEYLIEEVPKRAKAGKRRQTPFINIQFDKNFELSRVPLKKLKGQIKPSNGDVDKGTIQVQKKDIVKVYHKSENANNAIIFVHGFSGEAHSTFGQIPYLLAQDEKMEGWDMFPFGFNPNVNPQLGKDVWATVQDITRIADNLCSAIKYKFKKYDRIAIVGYSLGGLVAQRAILNLDDTNKDRLSHVILLGTPSNGITNNTIKKLWQHKINGLFQDAPFISVLRSEWSKNFNKGYPFTFKVVAATKDEHVSKESSLEPFDKENWITVTGDHFSMVNAPTIENDSYQLILDTLTNNEFFNKFTDDEEVNLILGEYDAVIRKLEPSLEDLDERGLEKLIHALEGVGRSEDAMQILKTHKIAQNDSDMLRNLGSLYKNKYLNDSLSKDGQAAFNCYTKALELAKLNNDLEDTYRSAINLAFLNLILEEDIQDMQDYARVALEATSKYPFNNVWKLATIAESNLYLGNFEQAKEYYLKAANKAGVRDKITIYTNAYTAYVMLMDTEDPKDDFINFLTNQYLS